MQTANSTRRALLAALAVSLPISLLAFEGGLSEDRSAISPNLIRAVQRALTKRGYEPGVADGIMGRRTAAAIFAFQSDQGLRQTGKVDDELLVALGLANE